MISVETNQVVGLFRHFHPEPGSQRTVNIIAGFDKWSLVTYSVAMLGRCNWWFWDANPQVAQLIRGGRSSVTVGDAARRFVALHEEISNCDQGFVAKINELGELVGKGGTLSQMIAVRGRNPLSTPSIIEGNHRSLAIWVSHLQGKVEGGRRFPVMVGRRSIFGL